MIVLLGSRALVHHIGLDRKPIDTDILGQYDDLVNFINNLGKPKSIYPSGNGNKLIAKFEKEIVESEINWGHGSTKTMFDLVSKDSSSKKEQNLFVPSLDFLYTLKMSHRYLRNSPHFLKTMRDIQKMRKHGAKIRPEYRDFYNERRKETYWYKHPKLNVTKTNFFKGDGVKYVYDHDSIHESVKHLKSPAYTYYSVGEVMCSKEKFFELSEEARLYGGLEESYVLALERSQIPFPGVVSPKKSFEIALMKVCTSITSGYFREFCWENYDKISNMYDDGYVDRFWQGVKSGIVKPH